jgi:N-acetylmuramoyl-L-alanine amidase-like protein
MAAVVLPPLVQRKSPNQSSRRGAHVNLLVWHESAGFYASGVRWLCEPTVYDSHGHVVSGPDASCHLFLREDGGECSQLVPLERKAWHAADFNPRSVGVEHANVTLKGYATEAQLRVSARVFGWLIVQSPRLFGAQIPPRWARGGVGPGVCYHGELGAAGGGHPSCGPDRSAWLRWLELLHDEIARGGYRKTWAT